MVDRYGANFRAERALAHQAIQDKRNERSFVQKCEVHIIAQSNKCAMEVLDSDISGMLSMSLCQQGGGTLGTLRAVLGEVIMQQLCVSYEMPPTGRIAKHREAIHDLFLPIPIDPDTGEATGTGAVLAVQRRFILGSLFNGDLESESITHFCPYACCASFETTEMRFRTLAAWALLPHKAPRYARNKWTNHSAAVQWSGLLASHHQLLSKLMQRWVGEPVPTPAQRRGNQVDTESAAFLEDLPAAAESLGEAADGQDAEVEPDEEPAARPKTRCRIGLFSCRFQIQEWYLRTT